MNDTLIVKKISTRGLVVRFLFDEFKYYEYDEEEKDKNSVEKLVVYGAEKEYYKYSFLFDVYIHFQYKYPNIKKVEFYSTLGTVKVGELTIGDETFQSNRI